MKVRALVSAGVLATAGLIATPAVSSAAPVTRIVNTINSVSCVFETVEGDFVFFTADGSTAGSGSSMFVETPDFRLVLTGDDGTATFGNGTFSAAVSVEDARTGDPVGVASVEATRTPSSEPVTERLRDRSGNSWTTGTVTTTEYRVDVESVTVPGYTVLTEEGDCASETVAFDVKTTNPTAEIFADTDFESAICALEGLPGGLVQLAGDLPEMRFEIVLENGGDIQEADGILLVHGGSTAEATVPLQDSEGEVGQLTISVSLDRIGSRSQESDTFEGITERRVVVAYRATITVNTSDGRSGVAQCLAQHVTTKVIVRPAAG